MMKALYAMFAFCAFSVSAMADTNVTGVVVAAEDQEPLLGAVVNVDGTSVVTVTDVDGEFHLVAPTGATSLTVSYVGMVTKQVEIKPHVRVVLASASNELNEVVVTGYGSMRKVAFTGAASIVDGDVIDRKSDVNFVKALEGQVTGFQYNNSTSMPGQYGSVYVRGMGSLSSSSQPLYVIDGVPVNSDYDDMSTNNNYFDPMAAYNPNDIESVTVLKDAAATAIYGSRAANGVIVITTKKGAEGKFNLNLDVKQGFSSVANNNMKFANAAQTMDLFARGYAARTGASFEECYDFLKEDFGWDGVSSYDWMDIVTRKAYYQDYNLSFSGSTGDTHYYASLGYIDTDGIVVGSSNTRYSGRLNLDTKYKFISVGFNASYSYSMNNSFSQSTSGSFTNATVAAISSMTPFDSPYNEDGSYANIYNYNPLAVHDKDLGDLNRITNQTVNANPWLRVDFGKGIWFKTNFGVNIMDQRQYQYWSAVYNPQAMDYNGLGQEYNSRHSTLTWTNTLGWDYTFNKKHNVNVLLGQEMQRYEYWYEYYCGNDFPFADSGMRDLATAGSWMDSEYYRAQSRLASYFGDFHYNYDNKYYVSASYRRDGSSVFGANNRWGNFWSVGGKWRLSEENFLKGNRALTNAAVRISYGTVGNQSLPSLYASRGYYTAGYNYNGAAGTVPGNIANPDLTWETSKKFDVGFDLSLFQRVHMTFDYYNDLTDDALYQVPISQTTGHSSIYRNIGSMRNRGVEFGVNGTVFQNRDINVNLFANITWNQNRVVKLSDDVEKVEGTYNIIEVGRPYRQFKMVEYAGVNPENGRALYYLNETGDETTEVFGKAAKRYLGSAEPKVFGAFGVSANAYGFDFSMQFNYRLGGKVFDSGAQFTGWGMSFRTPLECVALNSWTPENPNALYPQYVYGDPYQNTVRSSRYLMSGNYLRLSNITLGYTLPSKLTRKAYLQKVRFYTTMDNVHTWTASDFVGYNPETYSDGFIAWQYPAVFTFTGGIQVTF